MDRRFVAIFGTILALWMAAGRWAFGIGGALTWWYLPTIGLVYILLQLWLARRLGITHRKQRRTGRPTVVSLVLSWVCAVGFGLTVPDQTGDGLVSIISLASGSQFSSSMSIAICNPLGIIAFVFAIAAIAFAAVDARDPKPEEDEYDDEPRMVQHPLA